MIALAVAGVLAGFEDPNLALATSPLLIEFVFGVWLGGLLVSGRALPKPVARLLFALGLLGFGAGLAYGYERLPLAVVWGVPSALLVAGVVLEERSGALPDPVRRLAWLGDSSYSLYLSHAILLPPLFGALGELGWISQENGLVVALSLVPGCVWVGHLAYRHLELPLLERMKPATRGSCTKAPPPGSTARRW